MIIQLFPQKIYHEQNIDVIESASKLFDNVTNWKIDYNVIGQPFQTTLVNYNSSKVETTYDILSDKNSEPLVDFIASSMVDYLKNCNFTSYNVVLQNIWMNRMPSGSNHRAHKHYGYDFSGVFYVNTPENSGKLRFINPLVDVNYTRFLYEKLDETNSISWDINVPAGSIILFPSYLSHEVVSNKYEGYRDCIAFDINLV